MNSLHIPTNIYPHASKISKTDRERLNGHSGKTIWFTGLSGSGKSTLANLLEQELHKIGMRTFVLDGDNVRSGLNKDLGFSDKERIENIRRISEVSKLMIDAGLIVITAFISPFKSERDSARKLIGPDNFLEIYVNTPLSICESRDPKGLYKKARTGLIKNMTGIDSVYEPPINPDITINTQFESDLSGYLEKILKFIV